MKKKTLGTRSLQILTFSALLSAISIVCGKYLAINLGEVLRFSFENLPIIFAGIGFGPLVGGAVGLAADLLGCLLVGYAINPLVTLGAAAIGFISGASFIIFKKIIGCRKQRSRKRLLMLQQPLCRPQAVCMQ